MEKGECTFHHGNPVEMGGTLERIAALETHRPNFRCYFALCLSWAALNKSMNLSELHSSSHCNLNEENHTVTR